jgi:hypothetical protein
VSTYQQEECPEQRAEEEWTRQIRIVHNVLVDPRNWVQHSERLFIIVSSSLLLLPYMPELPSSGCGGSSLQAPQVKAALPHNPPFQTPLSILSSIHFVLCPSALSLQAAQGMRRNRSLRSRSHSSRGKRCLVERRRRLLETVCCGQIQADWSMKIGRS